MGLDLGTISASVGLNTSPLAADVVKAKAMFSGLDKSLAASGGMKNAEKGLAGLGNQLAGFGGSVPKVSKGLAGLGNEFATLSYFGGSATKTLGGFGKSMPSTKIAEKELAGLGNSLKNLSGFGGTATNALGALGSKLGALGTIGVVAGAVIGLGAAFYSFAKAAEEEAVITAQTNAVIESTGGVANVTAGHVDELGNSLAQLSGISHDTIKSAENIMLTFRGVQNIGKDKIFDEAIASTLDLSVALHKDLSDSAIKVGKALQDPIKGLTALRRYGIMFTDEQVEMAKQLVATGHTIEAQKMILEELRAETAGSAEAFGGTLAGQVGKLKDEWDQFKESVGKGGLPVATKGVGLLGKSLKGLSDFIKAENAGDGFAPKFSITTPGKAAQDAAKKALADFDKGMAKGGVLSVVTKVDKTELNKARDEINNLGKDVPEIILRFRDVGLAGTTQKEVKGMITMMSDYEPTVRASGIALFKGIMDAEAYAHPQIKAGMDQITTEITDKIMGMPTGQLTKESLNQIVQEEKAAHPEVAGEMDLIMGTLNQILAGPVTPPNIPAPTATDPTPTAQGVTTSLNNWFGANPSSPIIGIPTAADPIYTASGVTTSLNNWFGSHVTHPIIGAPSTQASPLVKHSSADEAGAYLANEIVGGMQGTFAANMAHPVVGGSAMSDLAAATALVNASFGNFIKDMTAEPLNEVNDAIMRLTANNYSSLGDWWKLRGAYDAGTASLAKYEKRITTAEKAVTTAQGKIDAASKAGEKSITSLEAAGEKAQEAGEKAIKSLESGIEKATAAGEKAITSLDSLLDKANAARERPSLVLDEKQSELQLQIMKAEDKHNYALAAKLNLQKEALDRKKEELDLTTQIADKTKGLKDTSAFAGLTTAQIAAQIASLTAQRDTKQGQIDANIATLKVQLVSKQAQVDAETASWNAQVKAKQGQIDANIATLTARLAAKEKQVAALKVTYDKVQTSVDKFKKIIDDLSAYFTSKSPAPTGYASGTSYVPRTGMALVHQGEQIIPANLNPLVLGSGRDTLITVPLYLDGKVIAKSVSRYQGGQANSRAMSGGKY